MSLAAYQRAATRVCFSLEPSPEDLALLGSAERWLLYRSMVRARFVKVVKAALPRTRRALGEEAFVAMIGEWLAEAPPSTRFFREVPEGFAEHAIPRIRAREELPPWLAELAAYEVAAWRTKYVEAPATHAVDFHFDAAPLVNPTLRLLRFAHPVHRVPTPRGGYAPEETCLALYRSDDNDAVTWQVNPMAAALLEAWIPGDRPLSQSVEAVAAARGTALGPAFLEKLSTMLADFLERGILLGSKGP